MSTATGLPAVLCFKCKDSAAFWIFFRLPQEPHFQRAAAATSLPQATRHGLSAFAMPLLHLNMISSAVKVVIYAE